MDSIDRRAAAKVSPVPSKCNLPLCRLVALLRLNLFSYRNLWDWLDDPFETPPQLLNLQLEMAF